MAPVAGSAEQRGHHVGDTLAISSMFERWRPPIMPSATTADSSDSIAPRSAMAMAGDDSARSAPT